MLGGLDILREWGVAESMVLARPFFAVDRGDCRFIRSSSKTMVASDRGCSDLFVDAYSVGLFPSNRRARMVIWFRQDEL